VSGGGSRPLRLEPVAGRLDGPESDLNRRTANVGAGPAAVEASQPSRGGHIAESLRAVTKRRRSAMWERSAARYGNESTTKELFKP